VSEPYRARGAKSPKVLVTITRSLQPASGRALNMRDKQCVTKPGMGTMSCKLAKRACPKTESAVRASEALERTEVVKTKAETYAKYV
jgi:hypothetical protein